MVTKVVVASATMDGNGPSAVEESAAGEAPTRAEVAEFAELAAVALGDGSLVKATLSRYRGREAHLKSAQLKTVRLKGVTHLQVLLRYKFRDVTKNYSVSEARGVVTALLAGGFSMAHLYTTAADWALVVPKKGAKPAALTRSAPSSRAAPTDLSHDREKATQLPRGAPFLQALGLSDAKGKPRPGMANKLRQVDRFCEVLGHALRGSSVETAERLTVVDMGAGRGYLTFATHAFLSAGPPGDNRSREVSTTGVEVREDLVEAGNGTAASLPGFEGLTFRKGTIAQWSRDSGVDAVGSSEATPVDILIALHACDTATDDAIFFGIQTGASVILSSPCCHKEVRRQLRQQEALAAKAGTAANPELSPMGSALQDVLRHGILAERQAELLTDSLRAALLESAGYEASVFEFVSDEHTAKNLMICAVKRNAPAAAVSAESADRATTLLQQFGIRHQRLAALMGHLRPSALVDFEAPP